MVKTASESAFTLLTRSMTALPSFDAFQAAHQRTIFLNAALTSAAIGFNCQVQCFQFYSKQVCTKRADAVTAKPDRNQTNAGTLKKDGSSSIYATDGLQSVVTLRRANTSVGARCVRIRKQSCCRSAERHCSVRAAILSSFY